MITSRMRLYSAPLLVLTLVVAWIQACSRPSLAADAVAFVVTDTGDAPDAVVGDGICETAQGSGQCTLHAAIEEANAQTDNATISFALPGEGPWEIDLSSALPWIAGDVSVAGPGARLLTVWRDYP